MEQKVLLFSVVYNIQGMNVYNRVFVEATSGDEAAAMFARRYPEDQVVATIYEGTPDERLDCGYFYYGTMDL